MADLARARDAIAATGTQVAFVHMSPPEEADPWFARYGLADAVRLSDPDKSLYRAFGLVDGTLGELAHPRVWLPWFRTAVVRGHGVGAAGPNWRQLTGVFVVYRGRILGALRHRNSAARPDYVRLVAEALVGRAPGASLPGREPTSPASPAPASGPPV